jgi:hypothetical protein
MGATQDVIALMLASFQRVLPDADLSRCLDNDSERRAFLASLLFE